MDGAWTLLLSAAVVIATAGLSWLAVFLRTLHVAKTTVTDVPVSDWVLVPGKRLLGSAVTREFAGRLLRAEQLWRKQSSVRVLVLGGHTSEGPFSEADQGRQFLLQRGLPSSQVQVEDRSHHTLENLQNAREVLGESAAQPLVLVTSRYHILRTSTLARGMGLDIQACAAEDCWQWSGYQIWRLVVESCYLHWYWVGRGWSLLTRNRKSLARIS